MGRSKNSYHFTQHRFLRRDFDLGVEGPVHCVDYDTHSDCFAVSIGHHVYIVRRSRDCKPLILAYYTLLKIHSRVEGLFSNPSANR